MPYQSICFKYPKGIVTLKDQVTGEHHLDEVYLTVSNNEDGSIKDIRIFLHGKSNEHSFHDLDDTNTFFRLSEGIDENLTVKDVLNKLTENAKYRNVIKHNIKSTFYLIINSLLYISSSEADIIFNKGPKKLLSEIDRSYGRKERRARQKLNRVFGLPRYDVGTKIVIDNSICQNNNQNNTHKYHFTHRFTVRGHWRHQKCGKNMSEVKIIWIKPYYKGPELANIINKEYKVK
jgi:hypothetical protein